MAYSEKFGMALDTWLTHQLSERVEIDDEESISRVATSWRSQTAELSKLAETLEDRLALFHLRTLGLMLDAIQSPEPSGY